MLTAYSTQHFSELMDFWAAKSCLDEAETQLKKLSSLIQDFHFEGRFGIALLHKHFDLNSDESLLKYQDLREAQIRPVTKRPEGALPYLFKTESPGEFSPLEFLESRSVGFDSLRESLTFLTSNPTFQISLSELLFKNNLTNIFGLVLLHAPQIAASEVYVETTDHDSRRLNIIAQAASKVPSDVTQTLWSFENDRRSVCAHVCFDKNHERRPGPVCRHYCAHVCVDSNHAPPSKES